MSQRPHRARLGKTAVIGVCGIALATALGCGSSEPDAQTEGSGGGRLDELRENGVTMAVSNLPPYSAVADDGSPSGYGPELAAAVLEEMGITDIEAAVAQWDAMIPGLQAGQWDLVSGGLNQTPERCQQVLFSSPDMVTQSALLIEEGNPLNVASPADIEPNDLTVAVVPATAEHEYLRSSGVDTSSFQDVPDLQAGVQALTNGRADLIFGSNFELPAYAPNGFEMVLDNDGPLRGPGVAFRQDDKEFRDAYDEALNTLKADGTLEQLAEEHFTDVAGYENFDAQLTIETTKEDLNPDTPECLE